MTGQIQDRNSQMVDNLRADLQPRYEPNFAWKGICGLYQALPALHAHWPMSAQINATQANYVSDVANNFHLANIGPAVHGLDDLIPYVSLGGTPDKLFYADNAQFDIRGVEANVLAKQRGLTMGCWFRTAAAPGVGLFYALMAKWAAGGNQRAYQLFLDEDMFLQGWTSDDGTAEVTNIGTHALDLNEWNFCVMRYDPSTSVSLRVNGNEDTFASAYASLFNSSAYFCVGANGATGGYNYCTGDYSMVFIAASVFSDSLVEAIWQQTRAMFRR